MTVEKITLTEKRSRAAKKGWETRRKRKQQLMSETKDVGTTEGPTITEWFDEGSLSQIYSSGLEFAFVNGEGQQCHPFAYCKDYLQDAIWATLNKCSVAIHGFKFAHDKNPPLDMERTRMALRLKNNKDFKSMCEKSLKFMHELEEAMGFEPSELVYGGTYKTSSDEIYVFNSDKTWLFSPPLISLYTLALRVGMTYEGGGWREHFENGKNYLGSNDNYYTNSAAKALDKIVGTNVAEVFGAKLEDNYPKDVVVSNMHHRSGIVSLASGALDAKVKQKWNKE